MRLLIGVALVGLVILAADPWQTAAIGAQEGAAGVSLAATIAHSSVSRATLPTSTLTPVSCASIAAKNTGTAIQCRGTTQSLRGIACPSALVCYVVGDAGTILVTVTGGQSWLTDVSGTSMTLRGIACPTSLTCYVAGDSGTIIKTTNGGRSWSSVSSGTATTWRSISCPSVSICYAAGGDLYTSESSIIATLDGGHIWTVQYRATTLFSVACPTTTICRAAGGIELYAEPAVIVGTETQGAAWRAVYNNSVQSALYGISCPGSGMCVAVGGYYGQSILVTHDNGQTWTSPGVVGSGHQLFGISCSSASTCVAVGVGGTIVATVHGGLTWVALHSGTSADLFAVACPSQHRCFAVGASGVILAS